MISNIKKDGKLYYSVDELIKILNAPPLTVASLDGNPNVIKVNDKYYIAFESAPSKDFDQTLNALLNVPKPGKNKSVVDLIKKRKSQ